MKQMKQTLWIVAVIILIAPVAVSAQTNDLRFGVYDSGDTAYGEKTEAAGMTNNSIGEILVNVMNWLMAILGIGAIISFVIAGILYLVAGGDEGKTEKAKMMMVYAIIALVVALVGYVIVNTVTQLTGSDAGDSSLNY